MFYIYIILGILLIHCTMYYLNIDVFNLTTRSKCENDIDKGCQSTTSVQGTTNVHSTTNLNDDVSISIETSINELKNLNQYIDNELGQTTFC